MHQNILRTYILQYNCQFSNRTVEPTVLVRSFILDRIITRKLEPETRPGYIQPESQTD